MFFFILFNKISCFFLKKVLNIFAEHFWGTNFHNILECQMIYFWITTWCNIFADVCCGSTLYFVNSTSWINTFRLKLFPVFERKTTSSNIYLVHVPNRRRTGHVDVVVVSKCSHVWMGGGKRGKFWDLARGWVGLRNGAVDPEHGTSRGWDLRLCTKGHHPK